MNEKITELTKWKCENTEIVEILKKENKKLTKLAEEYKNKLNKRPEIIVEKIIEVKGDTEYIHRPVYKVIYWTKWIIPLFLIMIIASGGIRFINSPKFEELRQVKMEEKIIEEQKEYDKNYQSWEVSYNSQKEKVFRKQNSFDDCMENIYKDECDSEKESLQNAKNELITIESEKPIKY